MNTKLLFVSLTKLSEFLGWLLVIRQFWLDHRHLGTINTLSPLWCKWGTFFGCSLIGGSKELGLAFCLIELTLKMHDPCSSHRIVFTCSKVQASASSSLIFLSLNRAGPLGRVQDIINPSCSDLFCWICFLGIFLKVLQPVWLLQFVHLVLYSWFYA